MLVLTKDIATKEKIKQEIFSLDVLEEILGAMAEKKINESDVIRMKTSGLVVGAGREVSLTSRGEKILKDKILSQPSVYFLNRTKEKFDFDKDANNKSKFTKIEEIK